ncbi:uncharacterized protein [Drosophila pseudoobscura]|uniref:Uncharacterized protein n=1 Tax=Drosophila pseudoobscura pseudoobscura TaxID=46245 RepID=A0A6I8URL9_DROPS|nr:uncharacterized protein LOC4803017 [Drosophila pseudoobscura]
MTKCTTNKCHCKSYRDRVQDRFYDCISDTECEDNSVSGGDVCKVVSSLKDPGQMRAVLERALYATQNLLRCYGSAVAPAGRNPPPHELNYYPATLEVSVTLKTEETCICPKNRQYSLRGDPVTLKLPIKLNPDSGQVKMNIYQPRAGVASGCRQCGAGAPGAAGDRYKAKSRKSSSSMRKVRWFKHEHTEN